MVVLPAIVVITAPSYASATARNSRRNNGCIPGIDAVARRGQKHPPLDHRCQMRVDEFDFKLPEDRIALRPVEPRDAARMLVVRPDDTPELSDAQVRDLPDLLAPGDVLVLNDTRVIPARLYAKRVRGEIVAGVEIMLHKREGAARWRAFARPAKKLQTGDRLVFGSDSAGPVCEAARLEATIAGKAEGGDVVIDFDLAGPALDEAIAIVGELPLPPYIAGKRAADARDRADYQTIYAREEGAVAAPTAGLHFTDALFARLDTRGIARHFVTLHVGAGTFLPVKVEDTRDHRMHAETGFVSRETADALNAARAAGGRIVAVGTTFFAASGERGDRGRHHRALCRRYRHLHHARLSLSRGRCADDQFPPAQIHADDARIRLQRPRHHAPGLSPCGGYGLSVLQFRRFEPAVSRRCQAGWHEGRR